MLFFKNRNEYRKFRSDSKTPAMSNEQEFFLVEWLEKCIDNESYIPSRSEFPPEKFGKYMSSVVIFDVLSEPLNFKYRLFGTKVREHSSADFTGKVLSELPGKGPGSHIWNMLEGTRSHAKPFYKEVPYVGPKVSVKNSTVLFLPMADDHMIIDRIFLVSHFVK